MSPSVPPRTQVPGPAPTGDASRARRIAASPALRGVLLLHGTMLAMAIVIVLGSAVLRIRDGRDVIVPIVEQPLPGTCTFQHVTGIPCPGCGLTRSFISLAHGRLRDAWNYNPAGMFFFALVAFQIPYRVAQIARLRRGLPEYRLGGWENWLLVGLVAVLLIQWGAAIVNRL